MRLGEGAGDGKAKTGPASTIEGHEPLERSVLLAGREAGTVVADLDAEHPCVVVNNNQDLAAFSLLDGDGGDVSDMGPIAAGATRWYRVYLNVPAGQLTNAMMGRLVEFGFTWSLAQ